MASTRTAARIRETVSSLLFVSLLLGSVLGGGVLTDAVRTRVAAVRADVVGTLEEATAQTLSWDAVSPSIVRGFTVYGVRISDNATARRVTVRLNLVSLLWGNPRDLIPAVIIDQPDITIATDEQRHRLERTLAYIRRNARGRRDISVQIRRGALSVATADGRVDTRNLTGRIELIQNSLSGTLATQASLETTVSGQPFSLSSRISADLNGIRGGPNLDANVEFREIRGSHLVMGDQSFRIERRADEVRLERVRSDDPLDLSARYSPATGVITMDVVSQRYRPADTVRLAGPWADFQPWLASTLSSDASLRFDVNGTFLDSSGHLAAYSAHPDLPAPLSVDATYSVSPREVSFDRLVAVSGDGSVRFRGAYAFGAAAPNGRITFRSFQYGEVPRLDGTVVVSGSARDAGLSSEHLTVEGIDLYRLVASYQPGERYHSARATAAFTADGPGTVEASARFADLNDLNAELRLREVATENLAAVAAAVDRPVRIPGPATGTNVSGLVRVDHRNDNLTVAVPYLNVRDPQNPGRVAGLSGEYHNGTIVLDQVFALVGGTRVYADGFVRLGSSGTIDFRTAVSVNSIEYPLRGTITPAGDLTVFGPDGVELRIERVGDGVRLEARLADVPVPVGSARVEARIEGLLFSRDDWYVNAPDVQVTGLPAPGGGTADLELALGFRPGEGRVGVLSYEDSVSRLAGSLDVTYRLGAPADLQVTGRIGGFDTEEQYRVAARYAGEQLAVDFRFDRSPAQRLSARARAGTVRGTFQMVGSPGDPQVRLFMETSAVRINTQDVEARVLAFGDSTQFRITNSRLVFGSSAADIDSLQIDRGTGDIGGTLSVSRLDVDRTYTIAIDGTTTPLDRIDPADIVTRPVNASITVTPASDGTGGGALPFLVGEYRFERVEGESRFQRDDGAVNAVVSDDGTFDMTLAEPLPVTFGASGRLGRDDVEVTVSGISVDLPRLADAAGVEGLAIRSGRADGSLRVLGPPADPDLFGTLSLRNVATSTPVGPAVVGPLDSTLIFEGKTVRMPRIETGVGEATVAIDGQAILNRFSLEQYQVNVAISGEPGLRVDRAFGPIGVDGYVRGNVLVGGGPRETRVQGRVVAAGTEIVVQDRSPETGSDRRGSLILDLDVETGRAVQFVWPDRDFPILRSSFATGQTIAISADTGQQRFTLTGELDIQSGDVFYFDRNFLIRDGSIVFNENQDDFDPRLTARAELREVTPDGPVRIYLVADGQRLSEFSPRFESNPPLTGSEIVAILGGNIFQQGSSDSVNLTTALLSTSDVVTQFGVFRQFEDAVRERLNLDLFAIRTSVIQNVLLSAITPADETQPTVSPSLGSYLNNTSIFMGRYLGDSVFGQAVLQLRSRDFGTDTTSDPGIQRLGGVLIDSEISLEWQTPFFLLEWNFAPQNPEELFIRDNTFTFSWSFSY